jgi:tRNA threonylcarbamoyladenosine biosynthesis protein TsaB
MALILNIETTTTNCSVSLSDKGQTISIKETADEGYSHGEKLHGFIDFLFQESGISLNAIDAVAVSKGPGSYTGLRIGVSAAKGLCYALDKPLISVSTLKALALQLKVNRGAIIPMIDARRMEVYSSVFASDFDELRGVKAEVLSKDCYKDYLESYGSLTLIGNAVEKAEKVFGDIGRQVSYQYALPSSREMGVLSEHKYQKSDVEDVAYFEPYYLKDFIAIKPKRLF